MSTNHARGTTVPLYLRLTWRMMIAHSEKKGFQMAHSTQIESIEITSHNWADGTGKSWWIAFFRYPYHPTSHSDDNGRRMNNQHYRTESYPSVLRARRAQDKLMGIAKE